MTLQTTIKADFGAVQSVNGPFGNAAAPAQIDLELILATGTGAGQADLSWFGERTVASGANDDIDLVGGLTDTFGNAIAMAELVGLILINAPKTGDANTTNLTIGGGSNPFTGFLGGTTPTLGPIVPNAMRSAITMAASPASSRTRCRRSSSAASASFRTGSARRPGRFSICMQQNSRLPCCGAIRLRERSLRGSKTVLKRAAPSRSCRTPARPTRSFRKQATRASPRRHSRER